MDSEHATLPYRRPRYALHPVRHAVMPSVPCQPLSRKWNNVQCSNFDGRLLTRGVTGGQIVMEGRISWWHGWTALTCLWNSVVVELQGARLALGPVHSAVQCVSHPLHHHDFPTFLHPDAAPHFPSLTPTSLPCYLISSKETRASMGFSAGRRNVSKHH